MFTHPMLMRLIRGLRVQQYFEIDMHRRLMSSTCIVVEALETPRQGDVNIC